MGSFSTVSTQQRILLPIICGPRDKGQLPNLFSQRMAPRTELILKVRNPWGFPELRGSRCHGTWVVLLQTMFHGKCRSSFLEPFCFMVGWTLCESYPCIFAASQENALSANHHLNRGYVYVGWWVGCFYSIYLQAWTMEAKREISSEVNIWCEKFHFKHQNHVEIYFCLSSKWMKWRDRKSVV